MPRTTDQPDSPSDQIVWDRSRDCAARAEVIGARIEREKGSPKDPQFMGWENHYSIADKRCYVSLGYFDPSAKAGGKTVPFFSTVIDAFENIEIVAYTTMPIGGSVNGLYWVVITDSTHLNHAARHLLRVAA